MVTKTRLFFRNCGFSTARFLSDNADVLKPRVLKFFLNKDGGAGYFIIGSKDHRFGVEKFEDIMRSENLNVEVINAFINNNDEYKSFLAEHNHFNARPLDKLCMYKVLARNSFGVAR